MRFRYLAAALFASLLLITGCTDPHMSAGEEMMAIIQKYNDALDEVDMDKKESRKDAADKIEALTEELKEVQKSLKGEKLERDTEDEIQDTYEDDLEDAIVEMGELEIKLIKKEPKVWKDDLEEPTSEFVEELTDLIEDLELEKAKEKGLEKLKVKFQALAAEQANALRQNPVPRGGNNTFPE